MAKKQRRNKVDRYEALANATRAERMKVIANLPSNLGMPVADKPKKTAKKKTPTD